MEQKPNPFGTESVRLMREAVAADPKKAQRFFGLLADGAEAMNKWLVEDLDAVGVSLEAVAQLIAMNTWTDKERMEIAESVRKIAQKLKN